jgi:CRP-like cAMP-binding protein
MPWFLINNDIRAKIFLTLLNNQFLTMNLLLQDIAKHVTLDPEEQKKVLNLLETKSYKAKTFLLKEGEICNSIYFVVKGILCGYFYEDKNIEKIIRFSTTENWITDLKSFNYRTPSRFYIKTLEDSEVLEISIENFEELLNKVPKLERYFRILYCQVLIETTDRIKDSLSMTAEKRYEKFIKDYPKIAYLIPQRYIASYIGVTPEFFSKLKAQSLKK